MFLSLIRVNASKCRLQGTCSTSPSTSTSPIEDYRFCQLTMQCIQCDFLENQVFLSKAISFSFFSKSVTFALAFLTHIFIYNTFWFAIDIQIFIQLWGAKCLCTRGALRCLNWRSVKSRKQIYCFQRNAKGFLNYFCLKYNVYAGTVFLNILKILLVNRNRCFIDDG